MTENNTENTGAEAVDKAKEFAADAVDNAKEFAGDAAEKAKGFGARIAGIFKHDK